MTFFLYTCIAYFTHAENLLKHFYALLNIINNVTLNRLTDCIKTKKTASKYQIFLKIRKKYMLVSLKINGLHKICYVFIIWKQTNNPVSGESYLSENTICIILQWKPI